MVGNPGLCKSPTQGNRITAQGRQVVHFLCLTINQEGPLRSSSVGGTFIPIVGAIYLGSNSFRSNGMLELPVT